MSGRPWTVMKKKKLKYKIFDIFFKIFNFVAFTSIQDS